MTYEYQDYPKYLYHPKHAPQGKVFRTADETKGLARKGWVDTPAKFPRPSRFRAAAKTWWAEWEWAVKALVVILGLIAAAITVINVLIG